MRAFGVYGSLFDNEFVEDEPESVNICGAD
jgi:hypothetical protein